MKYYLAIDIGASSGRHILGWREDERVKTREIYRFHNGVEHLDGHLVWNIDALLQHVKRGISTALSAVDKVSESMRFFPLIPYMKEPAASSSRSIRFISSTPTKRGAV